jgi:peroxiredoxin family protein
VPELPQQPHRPKNHPVVDVAINILSFIQQPKTNKIMAKMCIGLFSGGLDKLTYAGVVISGAAADDMDVDVYVHLQAAQWFAKGNENRKPYLSENNENLGEFQKALEDCNSPSWMEYFEMAKEMTNVNIYVCSLAGKIWGATKEEDFIDIVDGIIGIGEYIDAAKDADIHFLI